MARPAATDADLDPRPPRAAKRPPTSSAAAVKAVTAPAVPADQAFGNVITAQRDTAMVEEQALRSQLVAREGKRERDIARINAEADADVSSLAAQIAQQVKIAVASDAALESLNGSNIVQLRSEAAE